ncbi:MAG: 30S ribosome-binding factor RbfA [Lachnospiraceae bacterium]|nr:30S ribosome-binding factor RbfA [Lachnospiraceae bacterium]
MRKNSPKNLRVNQEVAHELSSILRGLKDPRISPLTTVMDAIVAPDLKTCKVFVSVMGGEDEKTDTMAGLKSAEGFIRRELAHSLNMRNTPELTFILDTSIERGVKMSRLIDEVMGRDSENEEIE